MAVSRHLNGTEPGFFTPRIRLQVSDKAGSVWVTTTFSTPVLAAILARTATHWGLPHKAITPADSKQFKISLPH